jgi:serine/threonine protein phosphatase PrpC
VRFVSAGASDVGRERDLNEDRFLVGGRGRLVAIADGMGGHNAGDVAASFAVETLEQWIDGVDSPDAAGLATALRTANARIHGASLAEPALRGMGTTIVAALFQSGQVDLAHAGDSRLYVFRGGFLEPITRDHSLREAARAKHNLTPAEFDLVPDNVILRALGMGPEVEIEEQSAEVEPGDRFLLCSDGLWGMIDDTAIGRILGGFTSRERALEELIRSANEAGGEDNVTAVITDVF